MNALRIVARVSCLLLAVAVAAFALQLAEAPQPFIHSRSRSAEGDPVDERIARTQGACEELGSRGPRWIAADAREARERACDALHAASGEERQRLAAQVDRVASQHVGAFIRDQAFGLIASACLLLACLLGALGVGRVGAWLALLGTVGGALMSSLALPLGGGGALITLAALGSARWGKEADGAARNRAGAALAVSALLLPLASAATLMAGWAQDSYRLEKRLLFTAIVAGLGWLVAGIPATVLVRGAMADAGRDGKGKGAVQLARALLFAFVIATAVAIGHSFMPPRF